MKPLTPKQLIADWRNRAKLLRKRSDPNGHFAIIAGQLEVCAGELERLMGFDRKRAHDRARHINKIKRRLP